MASKDISTQDGFHHGRPDSEWYQNLQRYGSCLKLLCLLKEDLSLIHHLGPEGITVLHKGVEHGCVVLVRFILVDIFDDQGMCHCGIHSAKSPITREQLLRKTTLYGSTAVNMVIVSGSPKMVVLLYWAIQMCIRMSTGVTEEMSSQSDRDTLGYDFKAFYSSLLRERGRSNEIYQESANDLENDIAGLLDVNDEDINILELSGRDMDTKYEDINIVESSSSNINTKVISIIENILEDPGEGIDRELMDLLKEQCQKHVDFEFVPVAHVFLHYLAMMDGFLYNELMHFRAILLKKIIQALKDVLDDETGSRGAMLKTLFNILDPRGRPFIHLIYRNTSNFLEVLEGILIDVDISSTIRKDCVNARDGVGRTILHLCCLGGCYYMREPFTNDLDLNADLLSSQSDQLHFLKKWCFASTKWQGNDYDMTPIQFAVLFGESYTLQLFYPSTGNTGVEKRVKHSSMLPLQLAAALGRNDILEHILEHHTRFNSSFDPGLGNLDNYGLPAIHCAALFGKVEAIQTILKFPVYDSIIQNWTKGTALHLLLNNKNAKEFFEPLRDILLFHVLPTSNTYKRVNNDILKLELDEGIVPKMFSANEKSCINLLLQAGIDIWTPNIWTKELPNPGPLANDEAREWWYGKVVNEVVTLKTSISGAANATSVIAALVATASFIGPFQPPLGYGDSNGHYIQTDRSPVRVYLVCNSLSFFFSIASILMAVLPAIPMPKESLYDELLRGQRCLKGAAMMLLISIICILVSFSFASLAVVSSEWQERQLVVACVICGGMICIGVLIIYIIRLLRMLFHRNDWFRRKFAKHMYF